MSGDREMTHRDEMESLLPFYLSGRLEGEDLRAVEVWLENDPDAGNALLAAEEELSLITTDNETRVPTAEAFKRFSLDLEKQPSPRPSANSWLAAFFARRFSIPAPLALATALAALVLVFSSVANLRTNQPDEIELAGAGLLDQQAFALVTFKPEVTIAQISLLLEESGGQIISGPSSGSTFKISLPSETVAQYDTVTQKFSASELVERVIAGKKPDAP